MESFHWDNCFATGLATVDAQHHRLVDLINDFGTMLTKEGGATAADLEPVFVALADYAQKHFRDEEAMMHSMALDPRHLASHRQAHAAFIDEVTRLHEGLQTDHTDAAHYLLRFLTHWLAYHILGQDQVMARQIAGIRAGRTPEDAYEAGGDHHDPATDALLHALNGLFHEVSERNRALLALNHTLEARVVERTRELSDANQRLEDMAMTDILTGLPNRRHALRSFELAWGEAVAGNLPLACMMIDADGFKQINDGYGHDAGDVVLRELARALQHVVRTDDLVCRLGGDEFLVICPNTPLPGALKLAEQVRGYVATMRVPAGAGEWRGSISVGVAVRVDGMAGPDGLLKVADEGVYLAKRNGRNCVATVQS